MTSIWGHRVVREKTEGTVNYIVLWFMVADSRWTVDEITYFYKAETFITIFSETCHSILSSDRHISKEPTIHAQFVQDWFNVVLSSIGNIPYIIFCQQNFCIKLSSFI